LPAGRSSGFLVNNAKLWKEKAGEKKQGKMGTQSDARIIEVSSIKARISKL